MTDFSGVCVGDRLRVKEDLVLYGDYDNVTVTSEMFKLRGQFVTITSFYENGRGPYHIRAHVREVDNTLSWVAEMFDSPQPSVSLSEFLLGGEDSD